MTHSDKGADGTEASQHPCLDGESDLWKGCQRSLSHWSEEFLTSRFIIVFELGEGGQPAQKQSGRVGYRWRLDRAPCNKVQNTTVMRTSPATVGCQSRGRTEPSKIAVPASTFTVIERGWS